MLLAEANQWPTDVRPYFGEGDECHMAFHFPLMPRMFMALRMEDRFPIVDILEQTPPIPDIARWALFLRNHDELTLEMVTDEERDYMYRVYAHDRNMRINLGIRRRLAPLLENDRRRIELLNGLLFSLPGTPVIYYGDEIGMGDNIYLGDRNGVRTPMQWSGDRNAGFSRANPQRLYLPVNIDPEYHYEAINVETQQNNPNSLLWWMKRIVALRKQLKAMGRGTLEFLYPENRRVLAFLRRYEDEQVLVVANLSRFTQAVELDLSAHQGMTPVELFGATQFPPVADRPYFLSLGPHAFYWFALHPKERVDFGLIVRTGEPPTLAVDSWEEVFSPAVRATLNPMLPSFLRARRWYRSSSRTIRLAEIHDVAPFPKSVSYMVIIRVEFTEGEPDFYTLALSVGAGDVHEPDFIVARLQRRDGATALLYSALRNRDFCDELLGAILKRKRYAGELGDIVASHTRDFRSIWGEDRPPLEPALSRADQDNTTLFYADRFALKLFRKVEEGPHPEHEISALLSKDGFPCVPRLAGAVEYRNPSGDAVTLALLSEFVRGGIEGWQYTLDHLGMLYENALARSPAGPPDEKRDEVGRELTSSYLENARLLGARTGEMHAALAAHPGNPTFAPERFTDFYRHGLYHGMLGRLSRTMDQLRRNLRRLPEAVCPDAQASLDREAQLRDKYRFFRDQRLEAMRIRIHGDYHLGQVLYTGKDFVIIDFEGDPARPLSERRIKRSPLQDVASMIDSYYHASHSVLFGEAPGVIPKPESAAGLEKWARYWARAVANAFLESYVDTPGVAPLLPANPEHVRTMIRLYLADFALQKLAFELTHAPERIRIPSHLIVDLLEAS
jgi:maltose alpha-D-glucosyltransferase/alpha-amylase